MGHSVTESQQFTNNHIFFAQVKDGVERVNERECVRVSEEKLANYNDCEWCERFEIVITANDISSLKCHLLRTFSRNRCNVSHYHRFVRRKSIKLKKKTTQKLQLNQRKMSEKKTPRDIPIERNGDLLFGKVYTLSLDWSFVIAVKYVYVNDLFVHSIGNLMCLCTTETS